MGTPPRGLFPPFIVFRGLVFFVGKLGGGVNNFPPRKQGLAPGLPPGGQIYPPIKGNQKAGVPPAGGGRFQKLGDPPWFWGPWRSTHCGRFFFFFFGEGGDYRYINAGLARLKRLLAMCPWPWPCP
eukprot:FR736574.1.p4 GENE.FR736574.1~~FR736574.1.p4  ORF type:complete len:126 (-),score=50.56 FR736574.1:821-1198(-)